MKISNQKKNISLTEGDFSVEAGMGIEPTQQFTLCIITTIHEFYGDFFP